MKLPRSLNAIWTLTWTTIREFIEDRAMAHAAAITFYALLSLAPLLVVVLAVAGMVWDRSALQEEVVGQFGSLMGSQAGETITEVIERAGAQPSRGKLAAVIGIVMLVIGALGVFSQIKSALNDAWEVTAKPGGGVWGFVRSRLLSLAMVMSIAFLLLISLTISATLSAMGSWLDASWSMAVPVMWIIDNGASLIVFTILFAAMYKILPDVKIAWRDVWIGAAATAVLFIVGKSLIGLYLGKSTTASVYGAAGSLVIILLWTYYSSMIFLLGAEFTQVFAHWRGADIMPSSLAKWASPRLHLATAR